MSRRCHEDVAGCHRDVASVRETCREMSRDVTRCHEMSQDVAEMSRDVAGCRRDVAEMSRDVTGCHRMSPSVNTTSPLDQRVDMLTRSREAGGSGAFPTHTLQAFKSVG